jgi:hypothetical protein
VLKDTFLGRFVVIGANQQETVGAHVFGLVREMDGFGRVVGTCAGDNRNTLVNLVETNLNDIFVLVNIKGR